jgi:hypothetical protein
MHDQHDQNTRHVRTTIPDAWARRLAHAAADLDLHHNELLREGVLLLLHHLGHGSGLRAPKLPEGGAR